MKVTLIKENEDGSADFQLDNVSPQQMQLIIQTGMIKLLEDAINKAEKEKKIPSLFKKDTL
jgi:hypothetical protein